MSTLPGGRIQCREEDGTLELHLPANHRALIRSAFILLATLLAGGVVFFLVEDAPLFISIPVAVFLTIVSFFVFVLIVGPHQTKTWVTIRRERLVLKTVDYGREEIQKYNLRETSRAKKHYVKSGRRHRGHGDYCQGIDVTSKRGTAHFGDSLIGSEGEMDWIEWRINRFLGHVTDADAPMAAIAEGRTVELAEPVAAPKDTKIRIEEDLFETRIHCPNTAETGSYSGVGTVIFGLGCSGFSGFWLFAVVQTWTWGQWYANGAGSLVTFGVMTLFGLLFLLVGLTQLFGRRRLIISPEKITFCVTLLGIGPWHTLPTAHVISVGSSTKKPRSHSGRVTGPTKGYVIRTATSEIRYGEHLLDAVRDKAEARWLAGEIARRIHAARSGELTPVRVRHRRPEPAPKPDDIVPKPPPGGPIPYQIDKRPMPSGEDLETLLPVQVGPFRHPWMDDDDPDEVRNADIEVRYSSGEAKRKFLGLFSFGGGIDVTLSICDNPEGAREVINVAQAEVSAFKERPDDQLSLNTEPSFFKTTTPRGAFMAWTRGNYYFSVSVHAKDGAEILDRFMEAFPY